MDQASQTMINNLQKSTGKSLEEWKHIVAASGLQKHNDIMHFLKTEHDFTHGFANMVALKAKGTDAGSAESLEHLVQKQ
jgi:hypothetical protein